ncbi:Uncharacterized protein PECH_001968 [Penicillium ucsense]|uniref:Anaphase-promoting complex subunit 4 WD40 domain-containing protein n=1 Tax=Penicillium ucsense TaxID=2839758 RepID=A0A8J8VYE5_9EURO|nr:Uncharacterized protein PECM_008834 [Penicillium ucsense]KAF7731367.1 Uncharacterized protein PECH_001968 [Penicillium ucsense]
MTTSSNRDHFFQTTAALDEQQRKEAKSKNSHGDPIKLESKILAVLADPWNPGSVYVAQSNGIVRRVVLETGQTNALYKGPEAPLTSLCVSPDGKLLFAGCWDKTVWSWDVVSRQPRRQYEGHSDFVKSVIAMRIDGKDLLVSGGADAKVLVFDIETGERTRTFKGHLRGILDLAVDPGSETPEVVVFSAGSDRAIRQFTLTGGDDLSEPILPHKTSVNKLFFDADGDLWTASADRTAKCLVRADGWKDNLSLEHPDFVRDVLIYEDGGLVITACRDEEVRVWNRSTGQLHHTFSGHFEEVTGLALVGTTVVSVAIDGTIRQWSVRPDELQKAVDLSRNGPIVEKKPENEPVLTEEEERELAELMGE